MSVIDDGGERRNKLKIMQLQDAADSPSIDPNVNAADLVCDEGFGSTASKNWEQTKMIYNKSIPTFSAQAQILIGNEGNDSSTQGDSGDEHLEQNLNLQNGNYGRDDDDLPSINMDNSDILNPHNRKMESRPTCLMNSRNNCLVECPKYNCGNSTIVSRQHNLSNIPGLGMQCIDSNCDASADTNKDQLIRGQEPLPEGMIEERFRVDRRKLEQMLLASETSPEHAISFFNQIMEKSGAEVIWPSKLKIGAKSKKDPHIKIIGMIQSVQHAKHSILQQLDTKTNRVTLKMDVSYLDHSHVIGKGGNNIKSVMKTSGCHIHFPDSNRNHYNEKSNQVSIAGQPVGVEHARQLIRDLLPLCVIFEVPAAGVIAPYLNPKAPFIEQISASYGVTVLCRQRTQCYTTVSVKGSVHNSRRIEEATVKLMEYLNTVLGPIVLGLVSVQLEIAPQHHLFMIGRGSENIKQIMHSTGTNISFPDGQLVQPRRGTICISGPIKGVLDARSYLIGCLPLVLMFDIKDSVDMTQEELNILMEKLDVFISIKLKSKQPSKSVVIKSIEKNTKQLFSARNHLLARIATPDQVGMSGSMEHDATPELVEPSCLSASNVRSYLLSDDCLLPSADPTPLDRSLGCSTLETFMPDFGEDDGSFLPNRIPEIQTGQLVSPLSQTSCSSKEKVVGHLSEHQPKTNSCQRGLLDSFSKLNSTSTGALSESLSKLNSHSLGTLCTLPANSSLCFHSANFGSLENGHVAPGSPLNSSYNSTQLNGSSESSCESDTSDHLFRPKQEDRFDIDYEQRKLMATKAIQRKPGGESRVATDCWSGMGFSKSMPGNAIKKQLSFPVPTMTTTQEVSNEEESNSWNPQDLSHSSYVTEATSIPQNLWDSQIQLAELFSKLGLGKYTDHFQQQEVDLSTFLTLNDHDLKELGIGTFGARRKMLLIISDLREHKK